MIRFLGFKKADAIATSLQKEVTMRKRETRQQPASVRARPPRPAASAAWSQPDARSTSCTRFGAAGAALHLPNQDGGEPDRAACREAAPAGRVHAHPRPGPRQFWQGAPSRVEPGPRGLAPLNSAGASVLPAGGAPQVMLVEHNQTRKMYAIKVLKKEFIIENDEVERCAGGAVPRAPVFWRLTLRIGLRCRGSTPLPASRRRSASSR